MKALVHLVAALMMAVPVAAQRTTFTEHVAPILYTNCVPCHRHDGGAPFPLVTFKDAAKRAHMLKLVTEDRYMPPQRNDPAYRQFAHERRLTDAQIATIARWVADSMPEGPRHKAPRLPAFPTGTALPRTPDVVLRMRSDVPIPGTNTQHYICYAIPFEFDRERSINAIDYIPGNRLLSHHASYQVLEVAPDVQLDSMPEYFVYAKEQPIDDDHDYRYFGLISPVYGPPIETFHGGWLPGMSPLMFPKGTGFRLPRRGVLLIRNLHYAPTARDTTDRASIAMLESRTPATRPITFAAFKPIITQAQSVIPADSIVEHRIHVRIRDSISVLTINPHMHLLGASFTVWANTPSGDSIPMVHIPHWDFDWQEFYRYPKPVVLPAGTILNARATFNNTNSNPRNPNVPPKDVAFEVGMDDSNEMMRLVLLVLAYQKGDEHLDLVRLGR